MAPSLTLRCGALLLVLFAGAAQARSLHARIEKATTPVATLQGIDVRLDWPAQATQGELRLQVALFDAPDLGYRWRNVVWRCPLRRDAGPRWRCTGSVRSASGGPLPLSLDLGPATTDASLASGGGKLGVSRSAATPDLTRVDLRKVPIAWAQALLAQAWKDAQLKTGTLDGSLHIQAPSDRPLRIAGILTAQDVALETADASVAGEKIGGRFAIDYRRTAQTSLVSIDATLAGGEFLAGSTYLSLPSSPVGLQIDAIQQAGQGWRVPTIAWRDGAVLVADGSAAFDADANLRELQIDARSTDMAPLRERYLTGQLALFGLGEVTLDGAMALGVRVRDGALASLDAHLDRVGLHDPADRFGFSKLDGDVRYAGSGQVDSLLSWSGGKLYGLDFGASQLPLRSRDGVLTFRAPVSVPIMGGTLRFEDVTIRPPKGDAGLDMRFALALDDIDFGRVSAAVGLPAFQGQLSGRIPQARYADEQLVFDGGLSMNLFDGRVAFSSLALERPFGTAPSLSADIAFDNLDLLRLTEVLDVGSITGRLDGSINGLRLVDWTPVAFDAEFHSDAAEAKRSGVKQRISQRAVQNISSVGDASFVGSLQGQLIGLFDDFGYARIGIACRLGNQVCHMAGLDGASAGSRSGGFTIVQGSGLPRLGVVGFNREVDWATLVERIAAAGKGDIKPVVE